MKGTINLDIMGGSRTIFGPAPNLSSAHPINIGAVTDAVQAAIEAWKTPDSLARDAELKLRATWEDYERRKGPAPTAELMAEVSRLRSQASEKLTVAMVLTGSAPKRA